MGGKKHGRRPKGFERVAKEELACIFGPQCAVPVNEKICISRWNFLSYRRDKVLARCFLGVFDHGTEQFIHEPLEGGSIAFWRHDMKRNITVHTQLLELGLFVIQPNFQLRYGQVAPRSFSTRAIPGSLVVHLLSFFFQVQNHIVCSRVPLSKNVIEGHLAVCYFWEGTMPGDDHHPSFRAIADLWEMKCKRQIGQGHKAGRHMDAVDSRNPLPFLGLRLSPPHSYC
mmetsp:Transcript_3489/g.9641  ORF Transcript_3489/g.9641 Transcript_3489/m.9641 type:complete len:227 (+) Transcript_3489:1333-2013(+)